MFFLIYAHNNFVTFFFQEVPINMVTLSDHLSTVVGGSQQFPCMCNIVQAANERPEPFSEEEVEAPGPGRGAAHQKHD